MTPRRPRRGARRAQAGMTLVEVMLASALLVVVLIAVTGIAMSFDTRADEARDLVADHEAARQAVGRITLELRSAGPAASGAVLLRTAPSDLVFASDSLPEATGQWRAARYCHDGTDLVRQVGPGLAAPASACPDPDWGTPEPVAPAASADPFGYSAAAGATPTVAITLASGAARPLESAVTVRNRALGADAVTCTTTSGEGAIVNVDVGVGDAVSIPVTLDDLVGLRAVLFGSDAPPASWECP